MKTNEELINFIESNENYSKILDVFSEKDYGKVFINDGQFEVNIPMSVTLIYNLIDLKDKIKDQINNKFDFDADNSSSMGESIDILLDEFKRQIDNYDGEEEFIDCTLDQYTLVMFVHIIRAYGEIVGYKEKELDDDSNDLIIFALTAGMCKDAMFDIFKLIDNKFAGVDILQEDDLNETNVEDLVS